MDDLTLMYSGLPDSQSEASPHSHHSLERTKGRQRDVSTVKFRVLPELKHQRWGASLASPPHTLSNAEVLLAVSRKLVHRKTQRPASCAFFPCEPALGKEGSRVRPRSTKDSERYFSRMTKPGCTCQEAHGRPPWLADLEKVRGAIYSNQGCLSFLPSKLGIKLKNT